MSSMIIRLATVLATVVVVVVLSSNIDRCKAFTVINPISSPSSFSSRVVSSSVSSRPPALISNRLLYSSDSPSLLSSIPMRTVTTSPTTTSLSAIRTISTHASSFSSSSSGRGNDLVTTQFGFVRSPLAPHHSRYHRHQRKKSRVFMMMSADDDDYDDEDEDDDDDWDIDEEDDDDILNELEDMDDDEDYEDDDDDDVDYPLDDDDDDDTSKIKATDDEYDVDEDELDELNMWDEDDEDEDDDEYDDDDKEDFDVVDEEELEESESLVEAGYDDFDDEEDRPKKKRLRRSDMSDMIDEEDDDPNLVNIVPLQDDPDDPMYNARKAEVEETVERRHAEAVAEQAMKDALAALTEPPEIISPADKKTLDKFMKEMKIDGKNELDDIVDEVDSSEVEMDPEMVEAIEFARSMKTADDFANAVNWNALDDIDQNFDTSTLSNETKQDIMDCLFNQTEGTSYNYSRWLLYDTNFNVTNLWLAAIKHNPNAPILYEHWYTQFDYYRKYKYVRDRDYHFTFDDVDNADISELERYYAGFGFDEIPTLQPGETGIAEASEMDNDEIKMAAFQNWITEVYDEIWDAEDYTDDTFEDADKNPFSDQYQVPEHPELPTFADVTEDIEEWRAQWAYVEQDEDKDSQEYKDAMEYRDSMAEVGRYKKDPNNDEFQKAFRGHLIIAIGPFDEDLDVAEKLTTRCEEEFGLAVYVETRIINHARKIDNVLEVWLESYEIDLIHSKRRATTMADEWDGPAEVDDTQLEYIVEEVRYLTSEEARLSEPVREPEFEM